MTLKTIKGINDESWAEFKSIAAKNKINMGKLFERMLEEYKKRSEEAWKVILSGKKILSDKEAEDMKKIIEESRKDYGFRT
jgi:DNA repair photolyase